jgi:hypothetical protein
MCRIEIHRAVIFLTCGDGIFMIILAQPEKANGCVPAFSKMKNQTM